MHGGGVLRAVIGRASTWQVVLIALGLIAAGALLVALGHLRGGIIGVVGVTLLLGTVRRRLGRDNRHDRGELDPTGHPAEDRLADQGRP